MSNVFDRIYNWQKHRNLLPPHTSFNLKIEALNILEELNELVVHIDSIAARNNAELQLQDLLSDTAEYPASTLEERINSLADIIIFASGAINKLGYNTNIIMTETIKEIESRTGVLKDGKFQKDVSEAAKANWYVPDYTKAKL